MRRSFDGKRDDSRREKNIAKPASRESLTPEEVWKNAAMLLGTKKKDVAPKNYELTRKFDFSCIDAEIEEINKERIRSQNIDDEKTARRRFYEIETANSLVHIPNFKELENRYMPMKPANMPNIFPKTPLYIFESQDVFKKLDTDTLFFIFYSQLGTIQQYYAAAQLKLYSWRFHTKYFTWFQRLDEPKLITSDYERGDFLFFDYDVTWSFMKKSDFTFEYKYLECSEW
ncbi:CCR4-NOT transcriptional regulation complex protein [Ordospora pajunii]|uniref:CCR4-NOT transcriptional regulation complex protein n=1 Tax=Ordospora pajunii TaxID=3039483 RepID=UPI00295289CB|nr:CCR4-NOT transcriptional regulation complex protein [Ordospora pajunii]KAH9411179.1 CCR4-NOT transcriptional regulation complex protein [Ordospora pajunii]